MTPLPAAGHAQTEDRAEAHRATITETRQALHSRPVRNRDAIMQLCRDVIHAVTGHRLPVKGEDAQYEVFPESAATEHIVNMLSCLFGYYAKPRPELLRSWVHDKEVAKVAAACTAFLDGRSPT